MKFSDIPGHEDIKRRMRQMVTADRLPHALLLEGPPGIGKLAVARAFAQYINCENPDPEGDACGCCQSCILHQKMNHIDTQYVYPVVKLDGMTEAPTSDDFAAEWLEYLSGRLYMDLQAWTETFNKKNAQPQTYVTESSGLIRKLSFTSHVSRYKIVIWWLPERMNEEAANKLLKLIEEPFENTVFLLVSDNPRQLLPTIYSRLQRLEMRRLPDDLVARYLMDNLGADQPEALAAAHVAEGNMTAAMALLSQSGETAEFFDMFVQLMRLAYQRNVAALKAWGDKLSGFGREKMLRFYDYAIRLIRENFIFNFRVSQLNYMTSAESNFSQRFARFIHEGNAQQIAGTFDRARIDIAGNGNGKIINFDVAIRVIMLLIKPRPTA